LRPGPGLQTQFRYISDLAQMPAHLGPLLLFTFGTLGASAVPPPPPGRSGLPGGNVNVPIGQPVPTMTSSANWPTSAVSKWMTASYTSSLVAPGVSAATSAVQSAFSTTVSYSNALVSTSAVLSDVITWPLKRLSGTTHLLDGTTGSVTTEAIPMRHSLREPSNLHGRVPKVCDGPILRAEVGDVIEILSPAKAPTIPMLSQESISKFQRKMLCHLLNPDYHSYVSLYEDTNTGLIGPTIIYATGTMDRVMSEYREIPFLFMIYTESTSFLSGVNAKRLTGQTNIKPDITQLYSANSSVWYPQELNIAGSEHFPSAPAFHTINGYTFSNNPVFEMCLGDKVLWYVMAYGSASHVFHMHGNSYTYLNNKQYATSINDGIGKTFIMDATGSGMWQVVCHVDKHLSRGMHRTRPRLLGHRSRLLLQEISIRATWFYGKPISRLLLLPLTRLLFEEPPLPPEGVPPSEYRSRHS
ncbi:hypothetical protein KCU67_g30, partial [Aureobasidium melanogenum]